MDATKSQTMAKFLGVNNVDSATRIGPTVIDREYVYPLAQANNVDIDNTFAISSRPGFASVAGSAGTAGLDNHSLWSDGVTCLYVDGDTLYELTPIYDRNALRTGLTLGARMSYVPFNDRIYYTNGFEIGYIKASVDNRLPNPDREFKEPLPAGQMIELFMGCLYVAKGSVLYVSDPLCDYFDIRHGYKQMKSQITLLRGLSDGMYIADSAETFFLKGKAAEDFNLEEAYPAPAIPFTDVRVIGSQIDEEMKEYVIMWTASNGICMGDNSGKVTNLTDTRYTFTGRGRGSGFIRDTNGVRHYINSLY
jgi:hypothetical protein